MDFTEWFPTRCFPNLDGELRAQMGYLGPLRLTAPFFRQSLGQAREAFPGVPPVEQRLEDLERLCAAVGREPTGFIFHMSRCGSTLVSRMLASLDRALVISEPEAINDLLLPAPARRPFDQVRWLRTLLRAFDKRPRGGADWFVVKFSSWNVLEQQRILAAFPRTPSVFIFREPIEVMISILRQPTGWLRWKADPQLGPYVSGLPAGQLAQLADEEFCACALSHFCRAALSAGQHAPPLVPLDYAQLPAAGWTIIPRLFGMDLTAREVELMRVASRIDAKDPAGHRLFEPDGQLKRQLATPSAEQVAKQWAAGVIAQLRALSPAAGLPFSAVRPVNPS
ncbi:MAG TPA: hypothetical protein VG125_32700 [Pirellulales bacterium]|jgi:hypothetical protein|nr:hypothetical protein [Pirellulales bacterium]